MLHRLPAQSCPGGLHFVLQGRLMESREVMGGPLTPSHCDMELAHEVRQCPLRSGAGEEEKEEKEKEEKEEEEEVVGNNRALV
eukprot:s1355_g16.t1